MLDLIGRIAVVTGAGSGIGRAIALGLVRDGCLVCGVGRDEAALAGAVATLAGAQGSAIRDFGAWHSYAADLADPDACRAVAARVLQDHGGVDILVHAAGVIELGRLAESPIDSFDRQYQVNARAPVVLTRAFLDALVERHGQVVFVNSSAGVRASAGAGLYGATKHALRAVADALRDEVNERGVRVVSVFVGRTATPMQARIHEHEGRPYHPERLIQPEDVAALVTAILVLPATAEVTEVSVRPMLPPE